MNYELRVLTPTELDFVAGGHDGGDHVDENGNGVCDYDEEIVVTGTRPQTIWDPSMGGSDPGGGGDTGGGGGTGEPIEEECHCSSLTPEEQQEQNIDAKVAEVLQDILNQANQNMEYGSMIWMDRSGVIQHTPLRPSPDYHAAFDLSVLPLNPDGTTDFSGIMAIVHSHPGQIQDSSTGQLVNYFDPNNPDRLLYPSQTHTRDGITQGDWITYDNYARLIAASGGDASRLQHYIVGWDGTKFVIKQYDAADRETNTSASGDNVDPNTEACTC